MTIADFTVERVTGLPVPNLYNVVRTATFPDRRVWRVEVPCLTDQLRAKRLAADWSADWPHRQPPAAEFDRFAVWFPQGFGPVRVEIFWGEPFTSPTTDFADALADLNSVQRTHPLALLIGHPVAAVGENWQFVDRVGLASAARPRPSVVTHATVRTGVKPTLCCNMWAANLPRSDRFTTSLTEVNCPAFTASLLERIAALEADSQRLAALEAQGVDNWEGYSQAIASLESSND